MDIKQFFMLRLIGKGAYGQVFLARKKSNEKVYAIKALKKKIVDQKKQVEHVMTEKQILTSVRHPFIVQLSYTFESDKHLYFALEYCPGGDLYNLLSKKQHLKEEQALFYSALMLIALEHLHEHNIIYRDLKPENVLLDKNGYIKLTDFGLSKILENSPSTRSIVGTPEYLAPEILQEKAHDKKVDWWSFGCIIYEMVVGQPPFMAADRAELFNQIKFGQPVLPDQLSDNLRVLLQGLLVKNPADRMNLQDIKDSQWFQQVDDWNSLKECKRVAPFIPVITGPGDYSNFDPEFTQQELFGSLSDGTSNSEYRLNGFSTVNSFE